jgi:hypothetical protein
MYRVASQTNALSRSVQEHDVSPLDPFSIHIRLLAANISLECALEHSRPAEIHEVVLFNRIEAVFRCVTTCVHFESLAQIRPIADRVDRSPPVIVPMIRIRAPEEPIETESLSSSADLGRCVEELAETKSPPSAGW